MRIIPSAANDNTFTSLLGSLSSTLDLANHQSVNTGSTAGLWRNKTTKGPTTHIHVRTYRRTDIFDMA